MQGQVQVAKQNAVRDIGEGAMLGEIVDVLLGFLSLRDISKNHGYPIHVAGVIAQGGTDGPRMCSASRRSDDKPLRRFLIHWSAPTSMKPRPVHLCQILTTGSFPVC